MVAPKKWNGILVWRAHVMSAALRQLASEENGNVGRIARRIGADRANTKRLFRRYRIDLTWWRTVKARAHVAASLAGMRRAKRRKARRDR